MNDKKKGSRGDAEVAEKRVPRLRFPEFRDSGEWEEKTLGKVCKTFSGGTPDTSNKQFYNGNIPFIRSGEIDKEKTELYITIEGLNNSAAKMVKKGDILVALYGANSGEVALSRIVGAINQAILCLRHETNNTFVYQYLSYKKNWIISTYIQGGQGNLSGEIIRSLKLNFPDKAEQQRIADCLSSLDELITTEVQKLDAYREHKKGLMQKLFPSAEEDVPSAFSASPRENKKPKLRFPEFRESGEWEEKTLGELAEFFKGKGISKEDIDSSGKILCIRYGELYTYYDVIIDNIRSRTKLSTNDLFISKINDVIIPSSGETKEDIARAACILIDFVALGGDINVIRSNKLNGIFLSYYLNSAKKRDISKIAQGDTVVHLYISQLEKLKISFPSLPEQQRIADCLSSLDDLISAQARKIELLKLHKKALMQGLFPSGEKDVSRGDAEGRR